MCCGMALVSGVGIDCGVVHVSGVLWCGVRERCRYRMGCGVRQCEQCKCCVDCRVVYVSGVSAV